MSDDLERLRLRRAGFLAPDRGRAHGGPPAFVGKVTTAAPAVGKFLLVNPVVVTGAETEGTTGTTTVDSSVSTPVYLVGPGVPVTGDLVVCRYVRHRWATSAGVAVPTHSCGGIGQIPDALNGVLRYTYSSVAVRAGGGGYPFTAVWTQPFTLNHAVGSFYRGTIFGVPQIYTGQHWVGDAPLPAKEEVICLAGEQFPMDSALCWHTSYRVYWTCSAFSLQWLAGSSAPLKSIGAPCVTGTATDCLGAALANDPLPGDPVSGTFRARGPDPLWLYLPCPRPEVSIVLTP